MMTRRESRIIALQTLFYLDFKGEVSFEEAYSYALEDFFDSKRDEGVEVEKIEKEDFSYNLSKNVWKKKDVLDEVIKKSAKEWPLEKISLVNKNILRIGIYELLFEEEKIPVPVIVNEAIVLSKIFNLEEGAHAFISGVLGTIVEISDLAGDNKRLRVEKEEIYKFGFLPFYKDGKKIKLGFVFNIFGKWALPKGSIKEVAKNEEEAVRKIAKEKLNAEGNLKETIGSNTYSAGIVNDKKVIKTIRYFLFEVSNPKEIKLNKKLEGLTEFKFFDIDEADNLDTYDDIKEMLKKSKKILIK